MIIINRQPKPPKKSKKHGTNSAGHNTQRPILIWLCSRNASTMQEIIEAFPHVPLPNIRYHIAQMVKTGHLLRSGVARATRGSAVRYSVAPHQKEHYSS